MGQTSAATPGIVTMTSASDAYEGTSGTDAAAPTTGADASGSTAGESGDQGTGDTGSTSAGETTGGAPGNPDMTRFADHVWPILDANCSCHKDDNGAGQLRMKADDAYVNLVEEPSEQLPKMMLVEPGSPDESYLWQKLNDTQQDVGGMGQRMPSSSLLDDADLDLIELWIVEGAAP